MLNWVSEEIKREIKVFLAFNESECAVYTKLRGHLGKFKALSAYIKNLEKSHTRDLTAHLKHLEQKEKLNQE